MLRRRSRMNSTILIYGAASRNPFTLEPESLEVSFDPRVIAGRVAASATAAAGGLITALFLSELISRIVGGVATLVASAVAFRIAHTATTGTALQRLQEDMDDYLDSFRATGVFVACRALKNTSSQPSRSFRTGRDDRAEKRPDGSGPSGNTT